MSGKQSIFERVLINSFSINEFVTFSKELLVNLQIIAPQNQIKVFNNFSFHINCYTHIANYLGKDEKKVAIFAVELNKGDAVERARSIQRNFVKKLLESGNVDGAIVAFYTVGDTKWRLSFVRMDFEFAKGKVTENLTPAKRYSYLVGRSEPCHTAKKRLFPIFINDDLNPSIDDLEEAFSVEKVTDEFFKQYSEKYLELRELLEKSEDFMIESKLHHFSSEQFAKKLMGQIVFLYFIQKKGWLGVDALPRTMTEKEYNNAFHSRGVKSREIVPIVYIKTKQDEYKLNSKGLHSLSDNEEEFLASCVKGDPWGKGIKDFMRKLFTSCEAKNKNYFNEYLEPLFYKALNVNRGENAYFPPFHCRIPFLNGGLFEQLDNYEWEHNNFDLPNSVFSNVKEKGRNADGILDIFDRYNFTMNEDEPMEKEVAIDPEMLGKIFENLLDIKDRKSKGAFYTPREIVHYMCQETLTNYLVNETGLKYEDIKDFILYGEIMKDEDTVKEVREGNGGMFISSNIFDLKLGVNQLENIDAALANVRVADPAVGSGAFPLGMINEIVRARETISGYYGITMNDYEKKLMYAFERNPYTLKMHTIKNCIFAVDIDPSAVDITKLRLWLSLVIEDEVNPNASSDDEFLSGHRDPNPLPNLDCNIRCGNSLIDELNGIKLINESDLIGNINNRNERNLYQSKFEILLTELIKNQEKLFFIKDHSEKDKIKQSIQSLTDQIIYNQLAGGASAETKKEYEKHKHDASLPYILWQLYFARVFTEKGGFDIIIGNPPFVGESGNKELFRPIATTKFGEKFYIGKMDLFYFFFHKAIDIGNNNSEIALITTNYYPTAFGAKKLREDLSSRTQVRKLINFNEIRIFESALGQHNMITFLTKNMNGSILCECSTCNENLTTNAEKLNSILRGSDKKMIISHITQDNLYDGKEKYIRTAGVISNEVNSIGSVLNKMMEQETLLGHIAEINQGVVSGCDYVSNRNIGLVKNNQDVLLKDGIFVLDLTNPRDKKTISTFTKDEQKLLRPFFKNSEIDSYWCNLKNTKTLLYLSKKTNSIDMYPNIVAHLNRFMPILLKRREAQTGAIQPFHLQWARKEELFTRDKIVVPYRTKKNAFAYNSVEWFCRSDVYTITAISDDINLHYLLALLNSKLYFVWLYHKGKRKGEILELFQVPLSEIPIIKTTEEYMVELSMMSKKITEIKRDDPTKDVSEFANRIDVLVYQSIHLTQQEISCIESAVEKIQGN